MTRLVSIRGGLDAREIEAMVPGARVESLLFYPYYWFLRRVRLRSQAYLVDARRGTLVTTDRFRVEWAEAPDSDVLEPSIDGARASELARRYLPGRTLGGGTLVHKPYWVVVTRSGRDRYLMDAHSARLCPLPDRLLQ